MKNQKQKRIYLSPPHMGGNELKYIQEAFDTNWIAPIGPNIDAFEKELADYLGEGVSVAALSSGTAAMHLALIILGVQRGDEVICQSFTFAGSCNPILYLGAEPVFVDSETSTWNMDPELLETAIKDRIQKTGRKPKAIIAVDLYGMPAMMDEIVEISRRFEIPLIEDAAEALGSSYKSRKCGTFGEMAILSFNGNKIITTSGGGALVSKNKKWIEKAKFLSTQARDPAPHYEHSEVGYNYRMSNICAGIGRGQLEVLDDRVRRKREIFEFYSSNLSDHWDFLPEPEGYFSNRWLTTALCKNPQTNLDALRISLEEENIETRPLWKPMHLQILYSGQVTYGGKIVEEFFENGICLPSGSELNKHELEIILSMLKS